MIIALPLLFAMLSRRVQNFAAEIRGDVIVAYYGSNQPQNNAAVGVSVEPFLQNPHSRFHKLLLEFLALLKLKQLVDSIDKGKLEILGISSGHHRLGPLLNIAPKIYHLLRAEIIDVL